VAHRKIKVARHRKDIHCNVNAVEVGGHIISLEDFLAPYDICEAVKEMSDIEMIKYMLKKNKNQNLALLNLLKIVKKVNGK
jgi:hypothetical protein